MTLVEKEKRFEQYLKQLIGPEWDSMDKAQRTKIKCAYVLVRRGIDWADEHPIEENQYDEKN